MALLQMFKKSFCDNPYVLCLCNWLFVKSLSLLRGDGSIPYWFGNQTNEFFTKLAYFNFYIVDNRYQQRTSQFGRVIPRWASSLFTKVFFSIALVFLCIVHVSTSVNLFHLLFRAREWCSYPSASFGNSVHRRTNSHYTFI